MVDSSHPHSLSHMYPLPLLQCIVHISRLRCFSGSAISAASTIVNIVIRHWVHSFLYLYALISRPFSLSRFVTSSRNKREAKSSNEDTEAKRRRKQQVGERNIFYVYVCLLLLSSSSFLLFFFSFSFFFLGGVGFDR